MKVVLQRVSRAEVRVAGERVGTIGAGLVCLVCAMRGDGEAEVVQLAERVARFRCFPDESGRMARSLLEVQGSALVVSQITLAADGSKGRRPSFDRAAAPGSAQALVERFAAALVELGLTVRAGCFGERMEVELVNDGPVTFVLEGAAPEG